MPQIKHQPDQSLSLTEPERPAKRRRSPIEGKFFSVAARSIDDDNPDAPLEYFVVSRGPADVVFPSDKTPLAYESAFQARQAAHICNLYWWHILALCTAICDCCYEHEPE